MSEGAISYPIRVLDVPQQRMENIVEVVLSELTDLREERLQSRGVLLLEDRMVNYNIG